MGRLSINARDGIVTWFTRTFERFDPAWGHEAVVIVTEKRRVGARRALLNSAPCLWGSRLIV